MLFSSFLVDVLVIVVFALVLNLTANKVPEHFHGFVLRWGWFAIAMYFTVAFMRIGFIQRHALSILGSKWWSYVVCALISAGVGLVYWALINAGVARLSTSPLGSSSDKSSPESVNSASPSPTPTFPASVLPSPSPAVGQASQRPRKRRQIGRSAERERQEILRALESKRPQHAHAVQAGDQITKEGLKEALSKKRTKEGLQFLVEQVRKRGVTFKLTPEIEKELRDHAAKAGNKSIDALIDAIEWLEVSAKLKSEGTKSASASTTKTDEKTPEITGELLAAWTADSRYSPNSMYRYITLRIWIWNKGQEVVIVNNYGFEYGGQQGIHEDLSNFQLLTPPIDEHTSRRVEPMKDMFAQRLLQAGESKGYLKFRVTEFVPFPQSAPAIDRSIRVIITTGSGESYPIPETPISLSSLMDKGKASGTLERIKP